MVWALPLMELVLQASQPVTFKMDCQIVIQDLRVRLKRMQTSWHNREFPPLTEVSYLEMQTAFHTKKVSPLVVVKWLGLVRGAWTLRQEIKMQ